MATYQSESVSTEPGRFPRQGDIIKNVKINFFQSTGVILVEFPYVIILSQDCDLCWCFDSLEKTFDGTARDHDKIMPNILVSPLYIFAQFRNGEHLSSYFGHKMHIFSSKDTKEDIKSLRDNRNPRYHVFNFPTLTEIAESAMDFKHYYAMPPLDLLDQWKKNFVCSLLSPWKEHFNQRFIHYFARIGLP